MADNKQDAKPAIIVKKGGHGGHHGGAWKIAYADFTTAMMCFFLCMWLINTASVTTRQAIASYFRKPSIFQEGSGQPILLGGQGILSDAYMPPRERDERKLRNPDEDQKTYGETEVDLDKLYIQEARVAPIKNKGPTEQTGLNSEKKIAEESRKEIRLRIIAEDTREQIERLIKAAAEIIRETGRVEVKAEPEGLKLEIMDTDKYSMFESGSARIRKDAEAAFQKITDVLKRYPNTVDIYGHTDAQPFPARADGYSNWELSADRANAARRLLTQQGFQTEKIRSVVGKASSEPRLPLKPFDPSNRRITLNLRFDSTRELFKEKEVEEKYNDPLKELLVSSANKKTPPPQPSPQPSAPAQPKLVAPTPAATQAPMPPTPPTPASSTSSSKLIPIPNNAPSPTNPDFMPQNKVFGDNPVIGPKDIFSTR
jgi:chemotaxis protein MotB